MEHALRAKRVNLEAGEEVSLNPYCNGTCSKRDWNTPSMNFNNCLNPYCNGTCSKRCRTLTPKTKQYSCLNPYCNGTCSKRPRIWRCCFRGPRVLILIVMEHALRVTKIHLYGKITGVLILIVMEHALRALIRLARMRPSQSRLNPYCNGTCSKRMGATRVNGAIVRS